MFNPNVIPPNNLTSRHRQAHLELYYKSQDVIAIYNPTDEDYKITWDAAVTGEAFIVPNKNRDIGFGKGILHCKRYIARHYLNTMGKQLIRKKSIAEWNKVKGQYRLEEQGDFEQKLALRTTDPKAQEEMAKTLWLGVVEKYRPGIEEIAPRETRTRKADKTEDLLDRTGLLDKPLYQENVELEPLSDSDIEQKKREFIQTNS